MRILLIVWAFAFLLTSNAWADPFLVVPGHSLGRTHLGRNGAYYLRQLPSPDATDAAMGGKRWLAWSSKASLNTLAMFTISREFEDPPQPGVSIFEIRATSPRFHTQYGVSPGATLAQIKRRFPRGHLKRANDKAGWYFTVPQGIAFEFASRPVAAARCTAVSVFPPGGSLQLTAQEVQDLLNAGRLEGKPGRDRDHAKA